MKKKNWIRKRNKSKNLKPFLHKKKKKKFYVPMWL